MRIVFFDIDETLAAGKTVPESAKQGIRKLKENGDLVFICTGRNITYVKDYFGEYADGFITNNGRLAWYRDRFIFDEPISEDVMKKLLSRLDPSKTGYAFYSRDHGYYEGPEDLFRILEKASEASFLSYGIKKDVSYYNFDVVFYDRDHFLEIEEALKDLCVINPHGPHPSADMTVKGMDKGLALRKVSELLNVCMEDTYAFGDGKNDVAMLSAAGHAIAMGNACKEAKEVSEYVTERIDRDGVYLGLKHYGLI